MKKEQIFFFLFFMPLVIAVLIIILLPTDLNEINSEKSKIGSETSNKKDLNKAIYKFCQNFCKENFPEDFSCTDICLETLNYKNNKKLFKNFKKDDCFQNSLIKVIEKGICNDDCLKCNDLNCENGLSWCEGGYKG